MSTGTLTPRQTRVTIRPTDRYFVNAPVDVMLIGGASLVAKEFIDIVRAAK